MPHKDNPKTKLGRKGKKVLREAKAGTLRSSSGKKVTNPKQAQAIAFSEQLTADKRKRKGPTFT